MTRPAYSPIHNLDFIVSEPYGEYDEGGVHNGVDLITYRDSPNVPLYSIVTGTVLSIGTGHSTLGTYITIKSNNSNWAFRYAHLVEGSVRVNVGDNIYLDTILGIMGSTGLSTGTHLHLEARIMDTDSYEASPIVNPCDYLGIENISYRNKPIIYFYGDILPIIKVNKSRFNWAIYGKRNY